MATRALSNGELHRELDQLATRNAITHVAVAGTAWALAKQHEMFLEDKRPIIKSEAITRLMLLPDPQKDGKLYSATAAEAVVMTDQAYALHRAEQGKAAADTIIAAAHYAAAKFRAQVMAGGGELPE